MKDSKMMSNPNNNSFEKNDFYNSIKIEDDKLSHMTKKKKFLKEIDGNEKLLRLLSNDRLKKLIAYYESVIKENNETIKRLKNS